MTGFTGIGWPTLAAGETAASVVALAGELERTQWLDGGSHRREQFAQLGRTAAWLAAHSPPFARRLQAAGIEPAELATPEALAALPVIERRWFQSEPGFYSDAVPPDHEPCGETSTSGSTGEFLTVRRTRVNQLVWLAMVMRDHGWRRTDFSQPLVTVRAGTMKIATYPAWGAPATLFEPTGPALTLPINLSGEEFLARMRAFRAGNLVSYPNALAVLLGAIERDGAGIPSLRAIRCVGEMVTPELRQRTRTLLGLEVADAYTSQEMGYIALQCPDSANYHLMAESLIVELLREDGMPCAEGEIGRVVLTDLHNHATPLVRYALGDLAEAGGACPCGRGLPTIKRIVGRSRNLLRKADGSRIWPTLGGLTASGYLSRLPVLQYQLVQTAIDHLEVRLVTGRPFTAEDEAIVRTSVRRALGIPMELSFRYFENRIPLPASGKFEDFISLV